MGDLMPSLPDELALDCLLRVPLQSHSQLKQVCRQWRALLESPDFYTARQKRGYTDRYACFIQALQEAAADATKRERGKGPLYGVTVYNTTQAAWERLPPINGLAHGLLPLFCRCAAVGANLVLMGGWDPLTWAVIRDVYIFSFVSRTWRRGADMMTPRSFFACASLQAQQKILVVGGHDSSKRALRTAEVYDVKRDRWEEVANMGDERDECVAVGLPPNKVLVLGGYSTETQGQFTRSTESFDFGSGEWKREERLWVPTSAPISLVGHEGGVYALSGGKLLRMGVDNEGWEDIADVPKQLNVATCATSSKGGILVIGVSSPTEVFVCQVLDKSLSWNKLDIPQHYNGLVQVACTIHA